MQNITAEYLMRAEIWLLITTLFYFLINGAQIFETLVVVPKWTAFPPQTFHFLADKNGTSLKIFWICAHSIHEITFILAIAFTWQIAPICNALLILFVLHFLVRVWTILYFAPNIINFEKIAIAPIQQALPANLIDKTSLWQKLNYIRVALFLGISIALLPLYFQLLHTPAQQ
jgi:hypothetical protein